MPQTRVLFVDDDVANQWLVTDELTALGFTVVGVCRGMDAVQLLDEGYEFDLLLTDTHLSDGMCCFALAEHWRHAQPDRPIVYTSVGLPTRFGPMQDDEGFICKHARASDLLKIIAPLLHKTHGAMHFVSEPENRYLH